MPNPSRRSPPLLLRLANLTDAKALSVLHGECFAEGWDAAFIERLMAAPGGIGIFASLTEGPPPCGFALARVVAGEAELLSLGVAPAARRQGAATALVHAIAEACCQREARQMFLEVAEGNRAARTLYEQAGFTEIGRRKGYYLDAKTGLREDALQLALPLGAAKTVS